MLSINLILVIITISLQLFNIYSLKRTLKSKTSFMHVKLVNNDYIKSTILPYKIKLLKFNRLYFITTLIVSIFFILFNSLALLLPLYLIIFLIGPIFYTQYLINNYIKEFSELNIIENNQDIDDIKFGILFNDKQNDHIYEYGYKRFAFNYGTSFGKAIIASILSITIIVLVALPILFSPKAPEYKIESNISTTALKISYKDEKIEIPLKSITSIKKLDTLPVITSKIKGIQENNLVIGNFNLQGKNNATLFIDKNAKTFIEFIANKKYYYFSDVDQANSNTIYNIIERQIPKK